MSIDMTQFYQVFFEESEEHLAEMEALLLALDISNPDSEQLNAIFRAAHSIKGSAGTFGFTDLSEVTHILENLLDKVRRHEIALIPAMVDASLEAGDLLKDMLAAHQGHSSVDPSRVEVLCDRLRELTGDETKPEYPAQRSQAVIATQDAFGVGVPRTYDIEFVPTERASESGGVRNYLDELALMGNCQVFAQPGPEEKTGFWHLRLTTNALVSQFSEGLDFIAERDAWRIEENRSVNDQGQELFGLFSGDVPGMPDTERGYGFFEPLEASVGAISLDDTFGLFEPLPAESASSPVGDVGGAYGFFDSPLESGQETLSSDSEKSLEPVVEVISQSFEETPKPTAPVVSSSATAKTVAAAGDSSIRVSVEKVDQLINLVGELVITQAMLQQTATQLEEEVAESLNNGLNQLERNTRDLQESVMSIRMLPISFVFSRFPRVVRDLSAKLGKQVELKTSGETTELDKGLIERIADPLTHLIRNSLDHGIEGPEARAQAGKPPVGTITLKASHQGGNVVIEVGDDGAGLNRQKILAKARERGMQVSDQMSDQEVFGLIFEAGFSTAEQVTDVSGRGVGMDVVRRNIQALGGRIEIESMPGIGTRMTVRLPLTLAILDGMSVGVGTQTYILPLSCVVESIQPRLQDIRSLANQGRVIQVRGEYLPVVVLHELFNLPDAITDLHEGIMVILEADGYKAGLFVDALLGQHQVVIKSLEANYRKVPYVSGATIMGDGRVALILDALALAGHAKS